MALKAKRAYSLNQTQFFEWQKLDSIDVREMSQWRKLRPP
jgi:hypothetical protein